MFNKRINKSYEELIARIANAKNKNLSANDRKSSRYVENIGKKEVTHICTLIFNQPECLEALHESLQKTCVMPWELHVVDNGSEKSKLDRIINFCVSNNIDIICRKCDFGMARASEAHGDGLDFIIKNFGVEDSIMMIVESDLYFVKKGWDRDLRLNLPKNGHATTIRNPAIYQPAAFLSMFRKKTITSKKISFMPRAKKNGKAMSYHDVGYQLASIPNQRWHRLGNAMVTEENGITKISGSHDIYNGRVKIASHLSRGRLSSRRKMSFSLWLDQCREYFKNNN